MVNLFFMAAVAIYKVRKPFSFDGKNRKIGEELIIDSRQADPLVQDGFIFEQQFLDPDVKDDAIKIAEVKNKMAGIKANLVKTEKARQKVRDRREAKRDEVTKKVENKKKVSQAK